MWLIVGLGNKGKGYDNTYHNIGFMTVDKLAKKLDVKFDQKKCKSEIAKYQDSNTEILIAKPLTFMNLSGQAVLELCKKFKINKKNIIVISDDIDLPRGKIRFRESGSGGTHNGLRNIVEVLQTQDFARFKLGIGREVNMELKDFVLSKIDPSYRDEIDSMINETIDMILEKVGVVL